MDPYQNCRICYNKRENTVNIFTTRLDPEEVHLTTAYEYVTNININEKDYNFPLEVCLDCKTRLADAYHLKSQAIATYNMLMLQNQNVSMTTHNYLNDRKGIGPENSDLGVQSVNLGEAVEKYPVEQLVEEPDKTDTSSSTIKVSSKNNVSVALGELDMRLDYEMENDDDVIHIKNNFKKRKDVNTNSDKTKIKCSRKIIHKCKVCDRVFARKSNLIDHLRLHAKVKLFQCNQCDKAFVQNANYRSHMRTHTHERPYKCNLCQKAYGQSGALNIHIRSHTDERNYQCPDCAKRFTNASDLGKHKRIHDPNKQIKCDSCNRMFAQKANMLAHKRRIHDKSTTLKAS